MESGLLYNPTMKQTNLRAGCKSAILPGTMTGRRSETFEDLWYLSNSLPRISTTDFSYIKGRLTDRLESTTALSILNGSKSFFVASRLIAEFDEFFLKIQVVQDKSKPTCVAMMWLRVKVNETRLCTAAHFAGNAIKYQKSRENRLFQYKPYACTIACLSFISLYKQKFYKCYSLSPS